jgi:hypothetical protein
MNDRLQFMTVGLIIAPLVTAYVLNAFSLYEAYYLLGACGLVAVSLVSLSVGRMSKVGLSRDCIIRCIRCISISSLLKVTLVSACMIS